MSPAVTATLARLPHLTVEELRAMHAEVVDGHVPGVDQLYRIRYTGR